MLHSLRNTSSISKFPERLSIGSGNVSILPSVVPNLWPSLLKKITVRKGVSMVELVRVIIVVEEKASCEPIHEDFSM